MVNHSVDLWDHLKVYCKAARLVEGWGMNLVENLEQLKVFRMGSKKDWQMAVKKELN